MRIAAGSPQIHFSMMADKFFQFAEFVLAR